MALNPRAKRMLLDNKYSSRGAERGVDSEVAVFQGGTMMDVSRLKLLFYDFSYGAPLFNGSVKFNVSEKRG